MYRYIYIYIYQPRLLKYVPVKRIAQYKAYETFLRCVATSTDYFIPPSVRIHSVRTSFRSKKKPIG